MFLSDVEGLARQMKDFLKFQMPRGMLANQAARALRMAMANVSAANARSYFRKSGHMEAYDAAMAEQEEALAGLMLVVAMAAVRL